MRVRQLQKYLVDQKCVRLGNLSVCRGMRLGIDAVYFFKSLKLLNDPLSDVYSALSPSFVHTLEEQLKLMQSLDLQPLFVFQGMQPKSPVLISSQMMGFTMNEGWVAYIKGDEALALSRFSQNLYKEFSEDVMQFLMSYLKSRGHEMIRAPYLASSQLLYFMQEGLIDAIVGPPSALLLGLPRVIVNLDLAKNVFEWVELDEVLTLWGIDRDQFIDSCLLAGTEHCLGYPLFTHNFSFANAIEYIKQGPLVKYLYQLPNREKINEYVDGYCVAKSMLNYPLVMTLAGEVVGLKPELPSDYHKIVGCRLPKSVYYLLSEGLLSVQLPFSLALGEWIDEPNQNVDSLEYRDLLSDLREYQCRALGLLSLRLDEQFKTKQIRYPRYVSLMKTNYPVKQSAKILIPNTCHVRSWAFTAEEVRKEMERQGVEDVGVEFCLGWHMHRGHSLASPAGNSTNGTVAVGVDLENELLLLRTRVFFMLLDNLGYFTNEMGCTVFGKVLHGSKLGMDGLLLLELMKFGLFTGESFESPPECPYPPEIQFQPKNEEGRKAYYTANLAARVATLCSVTLDSNLWFGRIDFDVASFNMVTKFLRRTLNYLAEGSLAYLLLGDVNQFNCLRDDLFNPLNPKMPLFYTHPTFLGVVVKSVLVDNESWDSLAKLYPNCLDLRTDLNNFVHFWKKVQDLLEGLNKMVQLGEVLEYFEGATLLVRTKFEKLGLDVTPLK